MKTGPHPAHLRRVGTRFLPSFPYFSFSPSLNASPTLPATL